MPLLRNRIERLARSAIARLEHRYRAFRDTRQNVAAAPPVVTETPPPQETPPPKKTPSWELRSQAELVDHIINQYHAGLRRDLPPLIEAARRIEREHRGHAETPTGLADLLESLAGELEGHMLKEERVLFPSLRSGQRGGSVDMPIRMMEREHESHEELLQRAREITRDLTAPQDAPAAWQTLYADIVALETALREHVYLENNVLFARALGGEY